MWLYDEDNVTEVTSADASIFVLFWSAFVYVLTSTIGVFALSTVFILCEVPLIVVPLPILNISDPQLLLLISNIGATLYNLLVLVFFVMISNRIVGSFIQIRIFFDSDWRSGPYRGKKRKHNGDYTTSFLSPDSHETRTEIRRQLLNSTTITNSQSNNSYPAPSVPIYDEKAKFYTKLISYFLSMLLIGFYLLWPVPRIAFPDDYVSQHWTNDSNNIFHSASDFFDDIYLTSCIAFFSLLISLFLLLIGVLIYLRHRSVKLLRLATNSLLKSVEYIHFCNLMKI